MKIITIVGARPQFIKAAAVSKILRKNHMEILVHTGQHYDGNMSEIFFDELGIPLPEYNLGVGSGSHGKQTAEMLIGIEEIILKEKPDSVLVYGDTNSTLAGALAASKLLVPVIHVEAGLRSYNKAMPEEQNRVLTDHISDILFCSTDTAVRNLKNEAITGSVYQVGDVMCDAVLHYSREMQKLPRKHFFDHLNGLYAEVRPLKEWYLATIHRAENTDTIKKMREILDAFEAFTRPVLFPVHPRTKAIVDRLVTERKYTNIVFTEPIGYLNMLFFTKNAIKVVTDSGGLQKEAYILGTNVVTIRDQTEWIETLNGNCNILCKPNKNDILEKVYHTVISDVHRMPFYGSGDAAAKICSLLG